MQTDSVQPPSHPCRISEREFQATLDLYVQSQLKVKMAQEKLALLEIGKVKIADTRIETVVYAPIGGKSFSAQETR